MTFPAQYTTHTEQYTGGHILYLQLDYLSHINAQVCIDYLDKSEMEIDI